MGAPMMKTVHLLRHAKSDWSDPSLCDFARPLSKRGIGAAKDIARAIADEKIEPDKVLCSSARRAMDTYQLVKRSLLRVPVSFHDELYMISTDDLMNFIRAVPDEANSILLIGHNPTTHDLALRLTKRAARGQSHALSLLRTKYPTGALCTIRLDIDRWQDVADNRGLLLRFLRPRDLSPTAIKSQRRPRQSKSSSKAQ